MPDEIQRPEPKAWGWDWRNAYGDRRVSVTLEKPNDPDDQLTITPLYPRADVIAWARQVVAGRRHRVVNTFGHDDEVKAHNDALDDACAALDTAAREWEESENG